MTSNMIVPTLMLDGRTVASHGAPFEQALTLTQGDHRVWVEADGYEPSPAVEFHVH